MTCFSQFRGKRAHFYGCRSLKIEMPGNNQETACAMLNVPLSAGFYCIFIITCFQDSNVAPESFICTLCLCAGLYHSSDRK